jgi:hypothetical protein
VFTLGSFCTIIEEARTFGLLFSHQKYVLILTKKELGYIWGDFCTILSGHPVLENFFFPQRMP